MNIKVLDEKISQRFTRDEVVFRIEAISYDKNRDMYMVTTRKDYDKKLYTHLYNPLLFVVDLPLRLAYLYGCLNTSFRQLQQEKYIFYWREIGSIEWNEWFIVNPYEDVI